MNTTDAQLLVELRLMKLSHEFAYYTDHQRYEELVQLFTPDALLDRVLNVSRGHAEILAGLKARPAQFALRHLSTNFHFTHVDENTVKGVVYNVTYTATLNAAGEFPAVHGAPQGTVLEFHDVYKRVGESWLFAQRVTKPVFLTEGSPMLKAEPWRPADQI